MVWSRRFRQPWRSLTCLCMPTSTAMPSSVTLACPSPCSLLSASFQLQLHHCHWISHRLVNHHFCNAAVICLFAVGSDSLHLVQNPCLGVHGTSFTCIDALSWDRISLCMSLMGNLCSAGALGQIDEMRADSFAATLDLNVRGTFLGIKHAARCLTCTSMGHPQ